MPITLEKGQKITLAKSGGGALTLVRMGLGWDAVPAGRGLLGRRNNTIDLDASCVMLDGTRQPVDIVWFKQLRSRDGSIVHTGDNLTGRGDGDDESIIVDLARVPASVTTLVFTVNSYSGQSFDRVQNAFCRLLDETSGEELARYSLSAGGAHTALIMASVYRRDSEWRMTAIGQSTRGRTVQELVPAVQAVV